MLQQRSVLKNSYAAQLTPLPDSVAIVDASAYVDHTLARLRPRPFLSSQISVLPEDSFVARKPGRRSCYGAWMLVV